MNKIDFKIKIPIYNQTVRYIVSDDFINIYQQHNMSYTEDDNECLGINLYMKGINTIIIKESHKNDWAIIAHECLHAVNRVLEHVGVEVDTKNDEAQAYLLSFLIKKIQKVAL